MTSDNDERIIISGNYEYIIIIKFLFIIITSGSLIMIHYYWITDSLLLIMTSKSLSMIMTSGSLSLIHYQ